MEYSSQFGILQYCAGDARGDSKTLALEDFLLRERRSAGLTSLISDGFTRRGGAVDGRVEWRDRWRTQLVHDTIVRVDSIVQVIEHPPERYVPPFYKRCTIALWVAVILIILGVLLKSRLRNIM